MFCFFILFFLFFLSFCCFFLFFSFLFFFCSFFFVAYLPRETFEVLMDENQWNVINLRDRYHICVFLFVFFSLLVFFAFFVVSFSVSFFCYFSAGDRFLLISSHLMYSFISFVHFTHSFRRYDAVIHLVSAAIGAEKYYTTENNAARTETIEEAQALDFRVLNAWVGHPTIR